MVTHVGRGLIFEGQPRPTPRGRVPALRILRVPCYLCVHPLSQNCQIWHNTYGEGLVLGGSLLGGSHALPSRGRSLVLGYAGCRLVAKIIETLLSLLAGQKQLKKLTVHQWIVFCHMTLVYYIRRARLIIVATFFNTYDEVYVYTAR